MAGVGHLSGGRSPRGLSRAPPPSPPPELTSPGRAYRHPPSHVPCRSRRPGSRHLHAGHLLAHRRAPARLVPETLDLSGFDVSFAFRRVSEQVTAELRRSILSGALAP